MQADISIGSNLGDRRSRIAQAVAGIRCIAGVTVTGVSSPYESAPWGYESANAYLNVAVTVTTVLSPEHLLDELLRVERAIDASPHRTPDGLYADRTVDIDLIAMEDLVIDATPRLVLPHPRMHMRAFVLEPMLEIRPDWRHPLTGLSVAEMLDEVKKSTIRRT